MDCVPSEGTTHNDDEADPSTHSAATSNRHYERFDPTVRAAHMWLSCSMCGSVSVWELWWVAAEAEECEGDDGFGSVERERDPGGNRILMSALGPWGIGFDEERSCAGFEPACRSRRPAPRP